MPGFNTLGETGLGEIFATETPIPPPPEFTGGGGSHWKKWYVPGLEEEEKVELKRIERKVKKQVAAVLETAGPGILSEGLEQIVKTEVAETAPVSSNAWLTPDMLQFIITRIEAQMRKAFVRKQQEAEDDDEDALALLS